MQVDFDEAVRVYDNAFDDCLKSPYLHPYYVAADAKRDATLSPVFFVFREQAQVFYYAFHLSQIPGQSQFDIQSPYGYGGPLANTDDKEFLMRAWNAFVQWCNEHDVLAEFVRFHPLLDNKRFFGGDVVGDREVVWIDLTCQDLLSTYSTRARTAIRKAQKHGLTVEWWQPDRFAAMFPQLYSDHMQVLNADEYYFFSEEYFRALIGWDCAHLAVCKMGEEVLAAAIFLVGPHHLEYHLSAATTSGRQLSATNLLIHEAALRGHHLGCSVMNLGGGTNSAPDNPLLFFKSGFSALRALFSIGKCVHLPVKYAALKIEWEKANNRPASRILFYR